MKDARSSTSGSTRRCAGGHAPAGRLGDVLDPAEVGRRVLPSVRAGELDQLAGGQRRRQALPRLLVDRSPAGLGDRRVLAEKMAALSTP